jgi:acetylxylan esterase
MFAAASEFSGEPAGCFFTGTVRGWNSQCAGGQLHKTPAQWAEQVHAMYPGYSGQYPRMQVFHGDVDKTLNIASFNESIKEWSGIHGYSGNPTQTQNNVPGAKLTKYIYGDRLQGIWGHGFGHVVPTNETEALKWFGIMVCFSIQYCCCCHTNRSLVLITTRPNYAVAEAYDRRKNTSHLQHALFQFTFTFFALFFLC